MRIPTAHIEPELKAIERFDAIRELLDRLVHAGAVSRTAQDSIFDDLAERERVMTTGVGSRLAMPHAESRCLSESIVAFGRSRTGIEFGSVDGLPVQFVFLFLAPPARSPDDHPIADFLRGWRGMLSHRTLQAIRSCSTAQEISAILNDEFNQ